MDKDGRVDSTGSVLTGLGQPTLTAQLDGVSGSILLSVGLGAADIVLEASPPIQVGRTATLYATASAPAAVLSQYPNLHVEELVTWSIDDASIASIEAAGRNVTLRGIKVGSTLVRGTVPGYPVDPLPVAVSNPALVSIELLPLDATFSLTSFSGFNLGAVGTFADDATNDITQECTWRVQDTRIATVSNLARQRGTIQFLRVGTTVVTAVEGNVSVAKPLRITN